MKSKSWFLYALFTMVSWGVWGAFTGFPAENGFPETLTYVVWAVTMIIPAIATLKIVNWQIQKDIRSVFFGLMIGFLGAGGQMVLFYAVTQGPTYLIFPIISLSPVITILLSMLLLKERTTKRGLIGIGLALCALPLFDYSAGGMEQTDYLWFILALVVLGAWGVQAYFMKLSQQTMTGESVFFYMTLSGILLIPVALFMTDFSQPINLGFDGPYFAAGIQLLNSVGALSLVFAFRYGKAIVVSPLTNAGAPLITAILSLVILGIVPEGTRLLGIGMAILATTLLALEPEN